MKQETKRNLFYTFAALLLAAISAALIFMVAPKRTAKADGLPVLSQAEFEKKLTATQDNDSVAGKYLIIKNQVIQTANNYDGDIIAEFGTFAVGVPGTNQIDGYAYQVSAPLITFVMFEFFTYNGAEYVMIKDLAEDDRFFSDTFEPEIGRDNIGTAAPNTYFSDSALLYENFVDVSGYQETEQTTLTLGGKIVATFGEGSLNMTNNNFEFLQFNADTDFVFFEVMDEELGVDHLEQVRLTEMAQGLKNEFFSAAELSTLTHAVLIPHTITVNNHELNLDELEFTISSGSSDYAIYAIPAEDPEQPGENPGEDPSETNTDEKKPFDFGEWLIGAGEDVSAWLGDNVGIATTGSTVLIVGAIIIAVLIFRKRR